MLAMVVLEPAHSKTFVKSKNGNYLCQAKESSCTWFAARICVLVRSVYASQIPVVKPAGNPRAIWWFYDEIDILGLASIVFDVPCSSYSHPPFALLPTRLAPLPPPPLPLASVPQLGPEPGIVLVREQQRRQP